MTQKIRIEDYKAPEFTTEAVNLYFDIQDGYTEVTTNFVAQKLGQSDQMFLHGENLELVSVKIDNDLVDSSLVKVSSEGLTLTVAQDNSKIEIINKIYPDKNTALEGLYRSDKILCTQNEPEGFRKITYFFDRSDVLCQYTTTISGDKEKYPYLLANGNMVASRDLPGGRHEVTWEDPFNKATYLFALVAGDLAKVTDTFTTASGRNVSLEFFVDHGNEDKCDFAIQSLKNAMKWDEETFDLEYDLDIYMVVAVDSFNMGAMENKGLNIFNSSAVLANYKMATDDNFKRIESIVGHEYFHNWTGNRVTLRNWFELTLKEGLTVFRDQEFSADMQDPVVQRIQDVTDLRNSQFIEDEGPMSHPIKPKEYEEINNFYTATVYNKGAEVIRMIQTIIGEQNFKKGMKLYFERFDGKAVTTEDFVQSMQDASGVDLTLFRNWYDEAGTPKVIIDTKYNADNKSFTINFKQETRNKVLHIPLKMGLILGDQNMQLSHSKVVNDIFHLTKKEDEIIFENLDQEPILSVNRFFSSPVIIQYKQSLKDYQSLATYDEDLFNRAEAFKNLIKNNIWDIYNGSTKLCDKVIAVIGHNLKQRPSHDYLAEFLKVPTETELNQELEVSAFHKVHEAREKYIHLLVSYFEDDFFKLISELEDQSHLFKLDTQSMGARALKNTLLTYMARVNSEKNLSLILAKLKTATNMTDELAALMCLGHFDHDKAQKARLDFGDKWQKETLVIDKWFSAIALATKGDTLKNVQAMEKHPLFEFKNPNKFRSLIGAFTLNLVHFHRLDGLSYQYVADKIIEVDKINPQVAARVLTSFSGVKKLPTELKEKMLLELKRIKANAKSKDVTEIAGKYLG